MSEDVSSAEFILLIQAASLDPSEYCSLQESMSCVPKVRHL